MRATARFSFLAKVLLAIAEWLEGGKQVLLLLSTEELGSHFLWQRREPLGFGLAGKNVAKGGLRLIYPTMIDSLGMSMRSAGVVGGRRIDMGSGRSRRPPMRAGGLLKRRVVGNMQTL